MVRLTFAVIPVGCKAHSHIKCFVPTDYEGRLTHYVPTGEDSYFSTTQQPVYDPASYEVVVEAEQAALIALLDSPNISTENPMIMELLTATAALIK